MTKALLGLFCFVLCFFSLRAEEVARIEETQVAYSTFADAVSNAVDGQTIKLLSDVYIDSQFSNGENKTITVDGNGFVLSSPKTGTAVATMDNAIILIKNNFKLRLKNIFVKDVDISVQPDATTEYGSLEIINGSYTNLRIRASRGKGSFKINDGDFYKGRFSVRNYNPDETANSGGSFTIDGGSFNMSVFEVYPEKRESFAWINSGKFTGCSFVCREATSSLFIGVSDLPAPIFVSCTNTIRGSFRGSPYTDKTIYKIQKGAFESCEFTITNAYSAVNRKIALEIFGGAFTNCLFNQRRQCTYLNITNGTFVSSKFLLWSTKDATTDMNTNLNISDGKFSGCSFNCETSGGGGYAVNLNFKGGEYRSCYVYQKIGYENTIGNLNVENGLYFNTTFSLRCAKDSGYVRNGKFYGCKFVAHGYECYASHYQKMYIEDGDYYGCVFSADNTTYNEKSGNPDSLIYLQGGNFYGCSTYINKEKTKFNGDGAANVIFGNSVDFKNAIKVGDVEYATLDDALSVAERPTQIDILYSVASIAKDSVYDVCATNVCYEIAPEEKLLINAKDNWLLADFSVAGKLRLSGGKYACNFDITPGGEVYSNGKSIFLNEPCGVTYSRMFEMMFDESNKWWYLKLIAPTFQLIVR